MGQNRKKRHNVFLIVLSIIFFPIALFILILIPTSPKKSDDILEKSFLLGETDDPTYSHIDMMIMDDVIMDDEEE